MSNLNPKSTKDKFTYEEYKKIFLPSLLKRQTSTGNDPSEQGITMARKALQNLKKVLEASVKKKQ